jgi:hypothetical protein
MQQKIEEGLQGTAKPVAIAPKEAMEAKAPEVAPTPDTTMRDLGAREKEALGKIKPKPAPPEFNERGQRLGVPTETPQDFGTKVRAEAPAMPRGERRARARTAEEDATTEMFRQARKELGEDATSDQIAARMEELKGKPKAEAAPAERSPEDVSKIEGVLKDHTDQELARLGKKYGVDESQYDFSKRDDHRHRVERDDFVNDVLSAMPDKDKDNVARLANNFDSKDESTWTQAERNNLSRAQRARAIMQEHEGGPKGVAGGAPEGLNYVYRARDVGEQGIPMQNTHAQATSDHVKAEKYAEAGQRNTTAGEVVKVDLNKLDPKDYEISKHPDGADWVKFKRPLAESEVERHGPAEKEVAGSEESSKKDREHFAQAKKELPDGTISQQLLRAQELKTKGALPAADLGTQVAAHNANGGSTFHPEHGDLKGKPYFAVGGEPEFRNPDLKMTIKGEELNPEQLKEFSERPAVKAALAKHPDASIGSWHDQEADQSVVELVKTPKDRAEAIKMGTDNDQKAIYDLKEGKEIPTGGTGEPKTVTLHHWSNVDDLKETDPGKFGTGKAGAEKERAKEEGFLPRTYFADASYKEPAIQGQKNHYTAEVDPSKYYDIAEDPKGIWQKGLKEGGATTAEKAVHDAGYHGYHHDGGFVSFEKTKVKPYEKK